MLKVMLVDDEVIIRQGLKKIINWQSVGFEIAGEASNGAEAIEKIASLSPDVVITDIRMASSDGIYLLQELKKRKADCKIIVISGYDDFSYIQEAMAANAYSYLLKPVDIDKLYKVMDEVREKILSERQTKNEVKAYNTLLEEKITLKLLNGADYDEVMQSNPQYKFPEGNYMTAIISIDRRNGLTDEKTKVFLSLTEIIDYEVSISENHIIKCFVDNLKYALVISVKDEYCYDEAIKTLNNILTNFSKQTGFTVTIGISGIFRRANMLFRSYEQCNKVLAQKAIMGNNRIIDYILYRANKNSEPTINSNLIISAIKSDDFKKAHDILNEYFSDVIKRINIPISSVQSTVAETAILIIKTFVPDSDSMILVFGRIVKPILELGQIELMVDIQNWINEIIDSIENHSNAFLIETNNVLVKKTIEMIHDKYDTHITLRSVADALFVSTRHLSRCFKQETNMTFNDYLTMYRMRKADILIETGNYKISEAASLVGYSDAKYFSNLYREFKHKKEKPDMA